jgi:hypothetical protein
MNKEFSSQLQFCDNLSVSIYSNLNLEPIKLLR